MLASAVLSLPESFVVGAILAVLFLLALVIRKWQKKQGEPGIHGIVLAILFAAALVCLAYASIVVVPNNKVAVLSNVDGIDYGNGPLLQGLNFKPPWDNATEYDDVIFASPGGGGFNEPYPRTPPMSRGISVHEDFVYSFVAEKSVDGSYLLANECIRTFNALVKAGQSALDEFTCTYDGRSLLVLREYGSQE